MATGSNLKPMEVNGGVLYQGNCLKVMRQLPEATVDLVFGSPPYENARLYLEDGVDLGVARDTEEWVMWMVKVFKASLRVSKGLVAFVVGHGTGARKWSGAPALLCADLLRAGICLRRPVYYKRNGIMGSGGNDWLRADTEWIICAANSDAKLPWSDNTACGHPPRYTAGGGPTYRNKAGERANQRDGRGCRKRDGTRDNYSRYKAPARSNPGDVIDCGAVGGGKLGSNISHENEAPFPIKLPDFFIRSFCPPGGVVLDPFMGSGTSAHAAIRNGRKFIGIDLRASQIRLIQRRIKQAHLTKGFGL